MPQHIQPKSRNSPKKAVAFDTVSNCVYIFVLEKKRKRKSQKREIIIEELSWIDRFQFGYVHITRQEEPRSVIMQVKDNYASPNKLSPRGLLPLSSVSSSQTNPPGITIGTSALLFPSPYRLYEEKLQGIPNSFKLLAAPGSGYGTLFRHPL